MLLVITYLWQLSLPHGVPRGVEFVGPWRVELVVVDVDELLELPAGILVVLLLSSAMAARTTLLKLLTISSVVLFPSDLTPDTRLSCRGPWLPPACRDLLLSVCNPSALLGSLALLLRFSVRELALSSLGLALVAVDSG